MPQLKAVVLSRRWLLGGHPLFLAQPGRGEYANGPDATDKIMTLAFDADKTAIFDSVEEAEEFTRGLGEYFIVRTVEQASMYFIIRIAKGPHAHP